MEFYFAAPIYQCFSEYYKRTGEKLNMLFSYALISENFVNEINRFLPFANNLMLDSGGFTYFNKSYNEKIAFSNSFKMFLEHTDSEILSKFKYIFAYDISESADDFVHNHDIYMQLRDVYKNIVPVIHSMNTDENSEIAEYAKFQPPAISIGKCKNKRVLRQIKSANDEIKKHTKSHLLGVSDIAKISVLDFDTSDSKSWLDDSTRGVVRYLREENGKYHIDLLYFPDYMGKSKSGFTNIEDYEHSEQFFHDMKKVLNLDRDMFFNTNDGLARALASILFYKRMEEIVNKDHSLIYAIENVKTKSSTIDERVAAFLDKLLEEEIDMQKYGSEES